MLSTFFQSIDGQQKPRRLEFHFTWRDNIPSYAALIYHGLFPGVDLRYDGQVGQLKGTYTVAPHTSPAAIRPFPNSG